MNIRTPHARRAFTNDQYYHAYFWSNPEAISHVDSNGVFLDVNPAFAKMLGYSVTEMIGRTWMEFTHQDDILADQRGVDMTLEGSVPGYTMTKRYRHKNGTYLSATLTVFPIGADTFEHFVSHVRKDLVIKQLVPTDDDSDDMRPSVTWTQIVKDNPWQTVAVVGLVLVLVFVAGQAPSLFEFLNHLYPGP